MRTAFTPVETERTPAAGWRPDIDAEPRQKRQSFRRQLADIGIEDEMAAIRRAVRQRFDRGRSAHDMDTSIAVELKSSNHRCVAALIRN
jgi:hypothetical protein